MRLYLHLLGIGMTCPDPDGAYKTKDDVVIPMGKGIDAPSGRTSLLYNEYPLHELQMVNTTFFVSFQPIYISSVCIPLL